MGSAADFEARESEVREDEEPYWQSPLGPARSVLPFVLGASLPVAVVAFLALYHSGKPALGALHFAAATLFDALCWAVVMCGVGGTIFALFHPTYPLWKRAALFVAWRIPTLALASVWYWVGFKREWFGTFSRSMPLADGAPNALVTVSDLGAGFVALLLGIGIYHRRWIHERYCKADPRTLGILRIVLGFLLASDCVRRWGEARTYYSAAGVLSNHYLLFRPFTSHNFTLWNAFSTLAEVHVIFAIATLCHVAYLVGYRTRLFAILSFVMVTSLDNRLVLVENGGAVVLNLLTAWSAFMPMGRRFSVDALLRSFREHKEKRWEDLGDRFRPADKRDEAESAVFLLALVNIAIVYFFNVVNKSGNLWKEGLTVHYVLHVDRMVTPFGVFLRELHLPLPVLKFTTWLVLTVEALICAWILSPFGRRYTRPLAMATMHGLHGLFGTVFRLGPFSWVMICYSYFLPRPENWADLETWYRRKAHARTVVLDRTSPLAFWVGRLLARLDGLDLLALQPSAEDEPSPPLVLVRAPDGRTFTGTAAFREVTQALPGGRYFRVLVWIGTLGTLGAILGYLEARRAGVARFFGLGLAAAGAPELPPSSPLRAKLTGARETARETLIAYLATCAFFQMMGENKCFPAQLKPRMPMYMQATTGYPRMFQGWGMFAANPITDDGTMVVDAITADGRHIDPFTGTEPDLYLSDARGLGLGQIRQDYWNRLRLERNKVYRQALKDYLLHWHERSGRPGDELVSFDVYWLRDQCPRPGETQPYGNEKIALLSYRKKLYVPPEGSPPIPPEPQIGNAEAGTPYLKDLVSDHGDAPDAPPMERRSSGDVGR